MGYLVLARKYRPRHFAEMVGQEHVVRAITNALATQRLHHAYLFTGTRGVGKTTVSRILAKSLNCEKGITPEPCGVCLACQEIDAARFIDYIELDAASNRGVEEVQSLLDQAVYKPTQGRFKIFMIDEVHMLTGHAFNAMLKTLEEPPEYMKFVLATTDPQKVPVTVLSRCLQFNLRPIPPPVIVSHLKHVLTEERIAFDESALQILGRFARGSMRDALSLTDQAIAYANGKVEGEVVRQMLGAVGDDYVDGLIAALASGDGKRVIEMVDDLRVQGLSPSSTLEAMTESLQKIAVIKEIGSNHINYEADDASIFKSLAQKMSAEELQLLYSICLRGRTDLGLASDEYCALTMVLLRYLAFSRQSEDDSPYQLPVGEDDKKKRVDESIEQKQETLEQQRQQEAKEEAHLIKKEPQEIVPITVLKEVIETPQVGQETPLAQATLAIQESGSAQNTARGKTFEFVPTNEQASSQEALDRFWFDTVDSLITKGLISALTRGLALQSQLVAKTDQVWMLRLEASSLNRPAGREGLTQAIACLGWNVRLEVEVAVAGSITKTPANRLNEQAAQRQKAAEQILQEDALVQSLMRDFGAKIVKDSIKVT